MTLNSCTRYLVVKSDVSSKCHTVSIQENYPPPPSCGDIRYSPIFPAPLTPSDFPPAIPKKIESVGFYFSPDPYYLLGQLKPSLNASDRENIYFSQGLASLILLNFSHEEFQKTANGNSIKTFEFWSIESDEIQKKFVTIERLGGDCRTENNPIIDTSVDDLELQVYSQQINASLINLWNHYSIYNPDEKQTLIRLANFTNSLLNLHAQRLNGNLRSLEDLRIANSIVSSLVEISAALSYAVTQGCSGAAPIFKNRAPFPHHSLLGVGGAVRGITKFTRYLESAFKSRNAEFVLKRFYAEIDRKMPSRVAVYESSSDYEFVDSRQEEFDKGGDFPSDEDVPLIVHFSLRHGFKESKFSVTAASEALTNEMLPQWTMMTLSHEVMHNRVREIFQALFGTSEGTEPGNSEVITRDQFINFKQWSESRDQFCTAKITDALRNYILDFCCSMERFLNFKPGSSGQQTEKKLTIDEVRSNYRKHKLLAIELFVHFHDYYFVYAYQPKMYLVSLWASWTRVAAPISRPREYLVRSLATVACGLGLKPVEAFNNAKEYLDDALGFLEDTGNFSPLFDKIRKLCDDEEEETTRAFFKICYFLIDQVRRFFASALIASRIDKIREDPFSEGTADVTQYSANAFALGQKGESISPIRYALNALLKSLSGSKEEEDIDDTQWLSAWNSIVISSQGANK